MIYNVIDKCEVTEVTTCDGTPRRRSRSARIFKCCGSATPQLGSPYLKEIVESIEVRVSRSERKWRPFPRTFIRYFTSSPLSPLPQPPQNVHVLLTIAGKSSDIPTGSVPLAELLLDILVPTINLQAITTEGISSKKPVKSKLLHDLKITWFPEQLRFEINETAITNKLWVWNNCSRSIYIRCCGLLDDTARYGAKWLCSPRTRFLLAPGLVAKISIRATPRRNLTPTTDAFVGLQIAVGHKRDNVIKYFVVPERVKFRNYIPQFIDEDE
ncbi:uncharacterized protein LOC131854742 [Achroia grisella]|uniref:uncharacterized protein LOC131854742 n=1 Tax=Achroia grisella TaxID=688607 RepID=UPI0027D26895|nr:uncharacterized protein LOC131854742 [Achroia grisella]